MAIDSDMIGIEVTVLTPFYYHSIPIAGGSATITECLSDTAFNFALASALGMMDGVCLPDTQDYRRDIGLMPFRCSMLLSNNAELLPAQVRRLNLDSEGGYSNRLYCGTSKGNRKDFYRVQEINVGAIYRGAIFGMNPFEEFNQKSLIVRVGKHRQGIVEIKPITIPKKIVLNAFTAKVFGRDISMGKYLLHNMQQSILMSPEDALLEVLLWN